MTIDHEASLANAKYIMDLERRKTEGLRLGESMDDFLVQYVNYTANTAAHVARAYLSAQAELEVLRRVVEAGEKCVGLLCKNGRHHTNCHVCALARALTEWRTLCGK